MFGVPIAADIRDYDGGNGAQPREHFSGVVEPAHVGIAGGELTIGRRVTWIFLDRQEQLRRGMIEAASGEEIPSSSIKYCLWSGSQQADGAFIRDAEGYRLRGS